MVAEKRHDMILYILKEKKFAEVLELADLLGVSAETIRRDLNQMEGFGLLKRVRGGAAFADSNSAEITSGKGQNEITDDQNLRWASVTKPPFRICGFPFYEKEGVFRRYPLNPPEPLPPKVEFLSWQTSGGQIRFHAEISRLKIRVKLSKPYTPFYNTTPLAAAGFDLYLSDGDGRYSFYSVARFEAESLPDVYEYELLRLDGKRALDILIHFPLGVGVENVLLGMDCDTVPQPPPAFATDKRIVVYGASIMHGFCASRPGMIMPNILSRRLNQEVINMGVNGRALCEAEVAKAVAMVENAQWLIVNAEGNCPSVQWIDEHMPEFLRIYRAANPDTKIAVMSFMREGRERFNTEYKTKRLAKKECQRQIVQQLAMEGDDKIFFWDAEEFTSPEEDILFEGWSAGEECTVDTQHKSDLGFWIMANGICRRLK